MKMIDKIMLVLGLGLVIASHIETKKKLDNIKLEIEILKAVDDFHTTQFSAQGRINEMFSTMINKKQDK